MVGEPLQVAVVASQAVVRHGLESLLGRHPGRVRVVEFPNHTDPDVVLFDVVDLLDRDTAALEALLGSTSARVLAVSRDLRPDLAARALTRGRPRLGLARRVGDGAPRGGGVLASHRPRTRPTATPRSGAAQLGGEAGLTQREVQVLTLIAQGRTNREVADELFLSPNSIKTYVRTAYRKIGATSRSQAVSWAIRNGFPTDGA